MVSNDWTVPTHQPIISPDRPHNAPAWLCLTSTAFRDRSHSTEAQREREAALAAQKAKRARMLAEASQKAKAARKASGIKLRASRARRQEATDAGKTGHKAK